MITMYRQALKITSQGLIPWSVRGLKVSSCSPMILTSSKQDIFTVKSRSDFEERVLKSEKPVLIDFHAKWCKPCKQLTPLLESALQQFQHDIHLAKVDIDVNSELALEYQVSTVPVVFGIRDGKVLDKFIGLQKNDRITNFVRKLLNE